MLSGSIDFIQKFGGAYTVPREMAVEVDGSAWVVGETYNSTTGLEEWVSGGYDVLQEGLGNGFVVKFDPGGREVWSTLVGGGGSEDLAAVALDGSGGAYVAGIASGVEWAQGQPEGLELDGWNDHSGFVTRISSEGEVIWSRVIGGQNHSSSRDAIKDIAVDADGNVWVTGLTNTSGWTAGGDDTSLGGEMDGFYAKLDSMGTMLFSGFLGGESTDRGTAITVDAQGFAYVGGRSRSGEWLDGLYTSIFSGERDFAARISPDGHVLWSTFIGALGGKGPEDVVIDVEGGVWFVGTTDKFDLLEEITATPTPPPTTTSSPPAPPPTLTTTARPTSCGETPSPAPTPSC